MGGGAAAGGDFDALLVSRGDVGWRALYRVSLDSSSDFAVFFRGGGCRAGGPVMVHTRLT